MFCIPSKANEAHSNELPVSISTTTMKPGAVTAWLLLSPFKSCGFSDFWCHQQKLLRWVSLSSLPLPWGGLGKAAPSGQRSSTASSHGRGANKQEATQPFCASGGCGSASHSKASTRWGQSPTETGGPCPASPQGCSRDAERDRSPFSSTVSTHSCTAQVGM